jgi:hypothetical protein
MRLEEVHFHCAVQAVKTGGAHAKIKIHLKIITVALLM